MSTATTAVLVGAGMCLWLSAGCHRCPPHSHAPWWFVRVPAEPLPASDWVELVGFDHSPQTGSFSVEARVPYEWAAVLVLVASDGRRVPVWHASTRDLVSAHPNGFTREFELSANARELGVEPRYRVELHAYVPNEDAPDLPPRDLDPEQLMAALDRIAKLPSSRRRLAVAGWVE